jgi:serine/threonine protein kinase
MQELRQLYNAQKGQDVFETPRTPPSSQVDFAPQAPIRLNAARVANRKTAKARERVERLGRGQRSSQLEETSADSRWSRSGEAAIFRESKANKMQATRERKPHRTDLASQAATIERVVATREETLPYPGNSQDQGPPWIESQSSQNKRQLTSQTALKDQAPDAGFVFDDGVAFINPSCIVRFMTLGKEDSTGFDTVWAGEMDGISVAVKVVGQATPRNEDALKSDVAAMMRARNAHIVSSYGYTHVQLDNGPLSLAVVTEFMQGGDLQSAIRQGNWSLRQKRGILLQVLDSLTFLHNQNVAHRNLKPSSILLSSDLNVVKLADFGLSTFKNHVSAGSPAGSLWQDADAEQFALPPQQTTIKCQVCTFINPSSSANCERCSSELIPAQQQRFIQQLSGSV